LLKYLYNPSAEEDDLLEGELLEEEAVSVPVLFIKEPEVTQIPVTPQLETPKSTYKWKRNLVLGIGCAGIALFKGANWIELIGVFSMGCFILGWFVAVIETYLSDAK
jgi:hypothetical protein